MIGNVVFMTDNVVNWIAKRRVMFLHFSAEIATLVPFSTEKYQNKRG